MKSFKHYQDGRIREDKVLNIVNRMIQQLDITRNMITRDQLLDNITYSINKDSFNKSLDVIEDNLLFMRHYDLFSEATDNLNVDWNIIRKIADIKSGPLKDSYCDDLDKYDLEASFYHAFIVLDFIANLLHNQPKSTMGIIEGLFSFIENDELKEKIRNKYDFIEKRDLILEKKEYILEIAKAINVINQQWNTDAKKL